MSGEELKEKLRSWNVNLAQLAFDLGYESDQRLHSNLKAEDVKSGLVERIAKALNRSILDFYNEEHRSIKPTKSLEDIVAKQQKTIESQQNTIDRLSRIIENLK